MRTLVIVPTYQESANVERFLHALRSAAPEVDVLVVDDNSPDGTADLAEKVGADIGNVTVLRRSMKDGLGNAYRAGFSWALGESYEAIVQMDVDLSHDPNAVPLLLARLEDGAGVAIGSRYVPGGATPHWPLHRRLMSAWGNRYAGFMLKIGLRDATSGFRAYRAEVVRAIDLPSTVANGYAFQMEVAYRLAQWGGRVEEVPITFVDRVRGTSKMSPQIMAESMLLVTRWGVRDRLRGRRARRGASS